MESTSRLGSAPTSRSLDIVPAPGPLRRVLRVPLLAKLAGANLLVALATWAVVFATHTSSPAEWRMFAVLTVALIVGLAFNLILVSLALRPIRDLERTAIRIWAGDLDTRVPLSSLSDADLDQLAGTVNYLLAALSRDRARVRLLASELVRTGDRERARVGKELHDSVAQTIAALRYQLIAIERDSTDMDLSERLQAVRLSAGELLEQVRLLSHTVHPQILDDLGLVPALRHLVRTMNGQPSASVRIASGSEADFRTLPTDIVAALYWIAQEAITNATRHAAPTTIEITLGLADGEIAMQVDDDGDGFNAAVVERETRTMGLFTMRERATLANGHFEIVSVPHGGSSVRVRIPVASGATAAPSSSAPILQPEIIHAR